MATLPIISLFTGAAGLDLGLEQAGFSIRVCVEHDQDRCKTLKVNRPRWKVIRNDIEQISTEEILNKAGLKVEEAALVSAGPPCQPFSKSAFWARSGRESISTDSRSRLLGECVRVISEARPRAYVIENVFGLAYRTASPILESSISRLKGEGYSCSWRVLNAADYGVPQKRQRIFIIGARDGRELEFPEPTTSREAYMTVGEAIGDLDEGAVSDEKVGGKWGHLLPLIPPGSNYLHFTRRRKHSNPIFRWRSRYWSFLLKLSPSKPSWTIQARPGPYTGPFHWNNRRLRISELKRIQTFPDQWHFWGDEKSIVAQIGDSVPPLLSRRIGEAIMLQLSVPMLKPT
jgi:DNA (cytosine-5)-methyltransferase 1